ncbi:MAG TPA: M1 family metallopeptidase [Anaerolineaceae bacterium]|nr:M1 family metallopeptidase [Anaerolineaceae bacterium]
MRSIFRSITLSFSLILLSCYILSACRPQISLHPTDPDPTPTSLAGPTRTLPATDLAGAHLEASPTVATEPPATPVPAQPGRTAYSLNVELDYARHSTRVTENVEFWNPSGDQITTLPFLVEPNRYPESFHLQSVAVDGQPEPEYQLSQNRLDLPLETPLAPAGKLSIHLVYQLDLPAIPPPSDTTRPVPYGYTKRQLNLVDWIPAVPPYRPGQGWLIHAPGYYGEHQVYEATDLQIDLVIRNAPEGLLVAASAPAQKNSDHYQYRLDSARNFVLSASPVYKLSQKTVGGVTILDYYFPFNPGAGERVVNDTADAVALYSRLFGPYPHETLSVVEADFLDGMEYDGLFFLSQGFYNLYDGTPKGYLTMIAAHETAHQWWYGLVGNDQALEPWLDEALATYTERIFYEKTYPDLVDWWWGYRVKYYQPRGWINLPVYDYGGFMPYRNAVYLRGALFLEEVRKRMGDEAFFAFLKDYATQEAYQLSSRQDFFRILSMHTQVDLQDLVREYFK